MSLTPLQVQQAYGLTTGLDDAALAAEVNAMRSQMMRMNPKSPQYLALKPRAIAMKRELDSRKAIKTAGNA